MEILVLDGKEYVKASKAAKDLGYTSDYIGQLCRSKAISAHLVGRTWYVNKDELGIHKVEKKRISKVKAREHAKKTIEEHRIKINTGKKEVSTKVDIRYEHDEAELIPKTRKLQIQASSVGAGVRTEDDLHTPDEFVVENKGNIVKMSGNLSVVDVTDELTDPETVFLTPKINRKQPGAKMSVEEPVITDPEEETEVESPAPATFAEKLRVQGLDIAEQSVDSETATDTDEIVEVANVEKEVSATELQTLKKKPGSVFPYVLVIMIVITGVLLSIATQQNIQYSSDDLGKTNTIYEVLPKETINEIRLRI